MGPSPSRSGKQAFSPSQSPLLRALRLLSGTLRERRRRGTVRQGEPWPASCFYLLVTPLPSFKSPLRGSVTARTSDLVSWRVCIRRKQGPWAVRGAVARCARPGWSLAFCTQTRRLPSQMWWPSGLRSWLLSWPLPPEALTQGFHFL